MHRDTSSYKNIQQSNGPEGLKFYTTKPHI